MNPHFSISLNSFFFQSLQFISGEIHLKNAFVMYSFFKKNNVLLIYFWLHCVFIEACGLFSSCGEGEVLSCCRTRALEHVDFSSCGSGALDHRLSSCGTGA